MSDKSTLKYNIKMKPGKRKQLSIIQKSRCLGWLDEGVNLALCARGLKVHPSTVSRLNARAKEGEGLEIERDVEELGRLQKEISGSSEMP